MDCGMPRRTHTQLFLTRARRIRAGLAVALLCTSTTTCSDDEHKGNVSQGPHPSAAAASKPVRIRFDPGSPAAAALVARRLRLRLAAFGVQRQQVRLVGGEVVADVPRDQQAAIETSLQLGRLDVHLADSGHKLAAPTGAGLWLKVVSTPGRTGQNMYLMAAANKRDTLLEIAQTQLRRGALVGPLFATGAATASAYRSYAVQPGRTISGENVLAVRTQYTADQTTLVLQLTPVAAAAARLAARNQTQLLLRIDGDVVAPLTPTAKTARAPANTLRFVLPRRGSVANTNRIARRWAQQLNGLSLGHRTTLHAP